MVEQDSLCCAHIALLTVLAYSIQESTYAGEQIRLQGPRERFSGWISQGPPCSEYVAAF